MQAYCAHRVRNSPHIPRVSQAAAVDWTWDRDDAPPPSPDGAAPAADAGSPTHDAAAPLDATNDRAVVDPDGDAHRDAAPDGDAMSGGDAGAMLEAPADATAGTDAASIGCAGTALCDDFERAPVGAPPPGPRRFLRRSARTSSGACSRPSARPSAKITSRFSPCAIRSRVAIFAWVDRRRS